jgi:excisionase family DNA binding protein
MCDQGPDQGLVDINWVAARLGVKPRMVRRLVHERRIPNVKVGGHVRFEPAEIERFIEQCRRPPNNEEGEEPGGLSGALPSGSGTTQ